MFCALALERVVRGALRWLALAGFVLALGGCVHHDAMISSSGYPGFNVFVYAHCGIAVQGNGSRDFPWANGVGVTPSIRASLPQALGNPLTLQTIEIGDRCRVYDSSAPVLRLVLHNWTEIDHILAKLGSWLVKEDYRGEIDAVVPSDARTRSGPPRRAQPSVPPPGPCVKTISQLGYVIYQCPSCGTAVVGTGSLHFSWRRDTPEGYDKAAFEAFRNRVMGVPHGAWAVLTSGMGRACYTDGKPLTLIIMMSESGDLKSVSEETGQWLASEGYDEEIDLVVLPVPELQ